MAGTTAPGYCLIHGRIPAKILNSGRFERYFTRIKNGENRIIHADTGLLRKK
jgi:hypothetical protein